MAYSIRKANPADAARLEELLGDYMRETYRGAWGGNAEQLTEHLSAGEVEIVVAESSDGAVIALLAWVSTYDLHWCMKGGEVIDLYVSPAHRGRGLAMLLVTSVASEIQTRGGVYLKGGAVEDAVVHRLYQRVAMRLSAGDYYLSGRAFRCVAELQGKSLREIARNLPETAWNYEP